MASNTDMQFEGTVVKIKPNSKFDVELAANNLIVECTLSGKIRINSVKVLLGDSVTVEVSPYDLTKGRIVWRKK